MNINTTTRILAIIVLPGIAGCGNAMMQGKAEHAPTQTTANHSRLHQYQPKETDAPWLAKAADLHGHLGPWVVVGAMIGQDAINRLHTSGQWDIEVICWMPPDKQHPPFTCVLDGLQAASGATMGKQNIRIDYDPAVVSAGQPVIYVVCKSSAGIADRGLRYDVNATLASIFARSCPDRIEEIAREIAAHHPEDLFAIQPLEPDTLARLKLNTAASTGKAMTH